MPANPYPPVGNSSGFCWLCSWGITFPTFGAWLVAGEKKVKEFQPANPVVSLLTKGKRIKRTVAQRKGWRR